ncbi:MAG: hypothetical protein RR051_01955 [Clostridiales bacterium]
MEQVIIIICLILMVCCGVASAMIRSMIKSAISLAAMSALLAIVLFMLGATWAGLFELSVCSGLITVIFISAISLTVPDRRDDAHAQDHRERFVALPFLLIFCGLAIISIMVVTGFNVAMPSETAVDVLSFNEVLWGMRQVDILGQMIILLAGAFAVVVLFKEGNKI